MMRIIILLFLAFNIAYGDDCKNTLFTFDIPKQSSNVKIIDIIENMAGQCKFSVKIRDSQASDILEEKLFLVHIENYTLDDMFDFLFTKNNMFYEYDYDKNMLSLSYLETKSFIVDYVNLNVQKTESVKNINVGITSNNSSSDNENSTNGSGGSGNSDLTTVTTTSEFTFWTKLESEINNILSRDGDYSVKSSSIINKASGIITITGTNNQMNRIEKYLEQLKDRMHKQVILEAKLIEVTYSDSSSKGINWGKFYNSLSNANFNLDIPDIRSKGTGSFSYSFQMTEFFKFLDTYGKTNVISTPKIMTLNNQPAVINAGQQINYRFQSGDGQSIGATTTTTTTFIEGSTFVGLILNIVPEITDDNYVILKINPVVSSLLKEYNVDTEYTKAPDIMIKQLSSIVKAKDNERVVIGGLVSYSKINDDNKIQILGDIPVFGYAFKNEDEQIIKIELIIVVTPTIINYDKYPSIDSIESLLSGSLNDE